MRKLNWEELEIETKEDILKLIERYKEIKPDYAGFDTETTGLHIKLDKAFLIPFGFYNKETRNALVCIVDYEKNKEIAIQAVKIFWVISGRCKLLFGHNTKFDLHMVNNINLPYPHKNISDTQILIRLTSDAITARAGGAVLKLKIYAERHIEREARNHEKLLKVERTNIAKELNTKLRAKISKEGWKWTKLQKFLNDPINKIEDLPDNIKNCYTEWYAEIQDNIKLKMTSHLINSTDIPYNILNRKEVRKYALLDVIYTLEIAFTTLEVLKVRKQNITFERENKVLLPLYNMEQIGMYMNKPYILEAERKLREYIVKRRKYLSTFGEKEDDLTCNQNKKILDKLQNDFKANISSTGKEALEDYVASKENEDANNFIFIVQELRTLEKWYKTYLIRFIKELELSDYIYTQLNQAGAVTGRLSSDFQQFPKGSINDTEGKELFTPRRMVTTPPEYAGMVFIDYSQIELRLQALYTILVDSPDINLCRAYMPYKCVDREGYEFDHNNTEDLKTFNRKEWFLKESKELWHPTDVHGATTQEAFPDVPIGSPEFKALRNLGKRINFAKNYGASRKQIVAMFPKESDEVIDRIDGSYYAAFPGVKHYHTYCYQAVAQGFGTNLFGRRFYGISGHNFINAAIQGSGADFLKEAIIKLDDYMQKSKCRSKMFINIHDEIGWILVKGEELLINEWKNIMEEFEGTMVPIVAEIDYTSGTWDSKKGVDDVKDIININKNTHSV